MLIGCGVYHFGTVRSVTSELSAVEEYHRTATATDPRRSNLGDQREIYVSGA